MAGFPLELSTVLDAIILILVFVLIYLVYAKLISPPVAKTPQVRQGMRLAGESLVVELLRQRSLVYEQMRFLKERHGRKALSNSLFAKQAKELLRELEGIEASLAEAL